MSHVIFTSSATAKNGRDGHVKSSDGLIDVKLVNPAENDNDNGSNPEQLFAAAYASCFDGALNLIATKQRKKVDSTTNAEVSFIEDEEDGGNKIGVNLNVNVSGVNQEEAEELVNKAHEICPYSKATRGNIEVKLNAQAID